MINNHVVIMAGGVGSRFWPLSTPEFPKQFIDVLGCGKSLIQLTADRFKNICKPENFWIVTNANYLDIISKQLPGIPAHHILLEPEARNTAPCIAWACSAIQRECPDANIVVSPSDAVIMDVPEFQKVIFKALDYTKDHSSIVTIGIKPSRPETGYGYVEVGDRISDDVFKVVSFKEKPDLATAKQYLEKHIYLWNAGIFVWSVQSIMKFIATYTPHLSYQIDEIMQTGDLHDIFPQCEKISIDYAVMEPAALDGNVVTVPADFGWSDLGNWTSLHEKLDKDLYLNSFIGNVSLHDCSDCIVHAEDADKVILQGLHGFIVSVKDGRLLVCKKSEEQRIKEFLK